MSRRKAGMEIINLPDYVLNIISRLEDEGYSAFAVGGCVRDSLLGLAPHDWDVGTSALPEAVCDIFGVLPDRGTKYGTVKVRSVQVTTFRRESSYTDLRRPDSVVFVSDISEDLRRRDFTVNALAYAPSRGLVDLFGGVADLEERLIRCVGEAGLRFREDCLRILRALRFAARLGFELEDGTKSAVFENKELILSLPVERFFEELSGLLEGEFSPAVLREYGEVFKLFIPEGDFAAAAEAGGGLIGRLKVLLGDKSEEVLTRLHAPRKIKKAVRALQDD
jgi:tRNA nucleotidyltransferase (CCA-adding enzyme)